MITILTNTMIETMYLLEDVARCVNEAIEALSEADGFGPRATRRLDIEAVQVAVQLLLL